MLIILRYPTRHAKGTAPGKITWSSETLMSLLCSLDNLRKDEYSIFIFQKGVYDFEIKHKNFLISG